MSGPQVILIGLMGAGKTSVGKELARRLGTTFHDLDALIVAEDGRDIPAIFAADGESIFRELEADALAHALTHHTGVLSLGGGTAMHPRSRALLAGQPVVLLEVEENTARSRLGRGENRPMLDGDDPMARWRELAAERLPVYREIARWRVDAGRGAVTAVARDIIDALGSPLTSAEPQPAPQVTSPDAPTSPWKETP